MATPSLAQISFRGDFEIDLALRGLAEDMRKKAIPVALRAGGKPVVKEAGLKAPRDKQADPAGTLAKSIGMHLRGRRNRRYLAIGPRNGFDTLVTRPIIIKGKEVGKYTDVADPARYGHLAEFGTSHSVAQPFLRPAFIAKRTEVKAAFIFALAEYQRRSLARLARRGGGK